MKPFSHQSIVDQVPQLKRGQVWCIQCGQTRKVDSGRALALGWPKCCGQTMTIDSPNERRALAVTASSEQSGSDRRERSDMSKLSNDQPSLDQDRPPLSVEQIAQELTAIVGDSEATTGNRLWRVKLLAERLAVRAESAPVEQQEIKHCGACRFWLPYIRDERWEGAGDCTNENLRGRIVGFDHTFGCAAFKTGRIEDKRWKR